MPAPVYNPTVYEHGLDAAKHALGIELADTARDKALGFALVQTAVSGTYRPFAAAHDILAGNPAWFEEGSAAGSSVKLRGSTLSLPYLAAKQAAEDARLGLDVPAYLRLSPGSSAPGPVLTGWQ
jgi:hypothetical protein